MPSKCLWGVELIFGLWGVGWGRGWVLFCIPHQDTLYLTLCVIEGGLRTHAPRTKVGHQPHGKAAPHPFPLALPDPFPFASYSYFSPSCKEKSSKPDHIKTLGMKVAIPFWRCLHSTEWKDSGQGYRRWVVSMKPGRLRSKWGALGEIGESSWVYLTFHQIGPNHFAKGGIWGGFEGIRAKILFSAQPWEVLQRWRQPANEGWSWVNFSFSPRFWAAKFEDLVIYRLPDLNRRSRNLNIATSGARWHWSHLTPPYPVKRGWPQEKVVAAEKGWCTWRLLHSEMVRRYLPDDFQMCQNREYSLLSRIFLSHT